MRVILIQNVPKIGKIGEIKEVSDGFARNMLLPQKMAVVATPEAIKALEFQSKLNIRKTENELNNTESSVEELDGEEFVFKEKAQEDGKLFGSVNEKSIVDKAKQKGFRIDKKQIKLDDHIKNTGEYSAVVNFDHGLEAEIKIIVESEEV